MAKPSKKSIAAAVLSLHGDTFAEELGINLEKESPSALFKLLCASLLFSARISSDIATRAAEALFKKGWTTPQKLADSTWKQRTTVLNRSGYARYDERTSTMLGETAELLLERYGGDLRKLRAEAGRDPKRIRELLKQFKGIGDVGVDIFVREAQAVWDELAPFADKRAVKAAKRLGLGSEAKALARLVDKKDFTKLVAGLVRLENANDYDAVLEEAG